MLHVITNIFLSLTYLEVTYSQSKNTRKSPWLINFHIKCLSKCIYPFSVFYWGADIRPNK